MPNPGCQKNLYNHLSTSPPEETAQHGPYPLKSFCWNDYDNPTSSVPVVNRFSFPLPPPPAVPPLAPCSFSSSHTSAPHASQKNNSFSNLPPGNAQQHTPSHNPSLHSHKCPYNNFNTPPRFPLSPSPATKHPGSLNAPITNLGSMNLSGNIYFMPGGVLGAVPPTTTQSFSFNVNAPPHVSVPPVVNQSSSLHGVPHPSPGSHEDMPPTTPHCSCPQSPLPPPPPQHQYPPPQHHYPPPIPTQQQSPPPAMDHPPPQPHVCHATATNPVPTVAPCPSSTKPKKLSPVDLETMDSDGFTLVQPEEWDGWPDGKIACSFTYDQWDRVMAHGFIHINWTMMPKGKQKGDSSAENWKEGDPTKAKCGGIIQCTTHGCPIILRAQTKAQKIRDQARKLCPRPTPAGTCGGSLCHIECGILSEYFKYKSGVYYRHHDSHSHPRPTHTLHLSRGQRERLEELVDHHPSAGPLQLLVGVPTAKGLAPSVQDISSILINKDRIKAELRTIRGNNKPQDSNFVEDFTAFREEHPDFIKLVYFEEITVISLQIPFMLDQLFKEAVEDDPVNGILTDAAHKFWKKSTDLLTMSTAYSRVLNCWVPILISYFNGNSASHYRLHFLVLLETIFEKACKDFFHNWVDLILNVVDFSEAERLGFILAWVEFWTKQPDNSKDIVELREDAEARIKGCQQHFREQTRRVAKISAVVPPDSAEIFREDAMNLLRISDAHDFTHATRSLLNSYPRLHPWLSWWLRESHASMLFPPAQTMSPHQWNSIPDSTNAEESLHWKVYKAIGNHHDLLPGLEALYRFVRHFEELGNAVTHGQKVRYGKHEPWKAIKAEIGRTKRTRDPSRQHTVASNSDSRPPDTSRQLVGISPRKRSSPTKSPRKKVKFLNLLNDTDSDKGVPRRLPGPSWDKNSCWLDSSLMLLIVAASRDFQTSLFPLLSKDPLLDNSGPLQWLRDDGHHPDSEMHLLFRVLSTIHQGCELFTDPINHNQSGPNDSLTNLVQSLKSELYPTNGFQNALEWTALIVQKTSQDSSSTPNSPAGYLHHQQFTLRCCSGDKPHDRMNQKHCQVSLRPRAQSRIPLNKATAEVYSGNLVDYFKELIHVKFDVKLTNSSPHCFHNQDMHMFWCHGTADTRPLILHLPNVLFFEIERPYESQAIASDRVPNTWYFPPTLHPLGKNEGNTHGLVYEIVGVILGNKEESHYTCRFTVDGQNVYSHDGYSRQTHGNAVLEEEMDVARMIYGWRSYHPDEGHHDIAVLYHLCGGQQAQELFFSKQTERIRKTHSLEFHANNGLVQPRMIESKYELVPQIDRVWLQNPLRSDLEDYAQIPKNVHANESVLGNREPFIKPDASAGRTTLDLDFTNSQGAPPLSKPKDLKNNKKCKRSHSNTTDTLKGKKSKQEAPGAHPSPSPPPAPTLSSSKPKPRPKVQGRAQPKQHTTTTTLSPSQSPPPKESSKSPQGKQSSQVSDFLVRCRCGLEGDGNQLAEESPLMIQCDNLDVCGNWCHVACYPGIDVRTLETVQQVPFLCSGCSNWYDQVLLPENILPSAQGAELEAPKTRHSSRLRSADSRKIVPPELKFRLRLGLGVLANIGKYWFPGRLVYHDEDRMQWKVKLWRGCQFPKNVCPARNLLHSISIEDGALEEKLVDSLWGQNVERRKIRLGRWILSKDSGMAHGLAPNSMDPDWEAVMLLECSMFDHSLATGEGGKYQWGLDVGAHQGRWNPYQELGFLGLSMKQTTLLTGPDFSEGSSEYESEPLADD